MKAQEAGEMSMNLEWNVNIAKRLQECVENIMEASISTVTDTRKKVYKCSSQLKKHTLCLTIIVPSNNTIIDSTNTMSEM